MWRSLGLIAAAVLASTPLSAAQTAIGYQILEDFEGRPLGAASINFCSVPYPLEDCLGTLSGGAIELGTPAFPAASPSHIYVGTFISLDIEDAYNYSWPAISALVSGTAPIRLRAYEYDADLGTDVFVGDVWSAGNDVNTFLGFGSDFNPRFLTLVEISSDANFAIDDFRAGLPDVGPGIPEPASWAMLIAGFGLVGAVMRRRPLAERAT